LTSSSKPDWHALFAPLPPEAAVKREPIAALGWEQLSVELSAGALGLRHLLVVIDGNGVPISAGDWVLHCSGKPVEYVHENVGGRIQPDGSFLGTRWRTVAVEVPGKDDPETKETTSSEPTAEDVQALMQLVKEILGRTKKA
jgi:hypothetical protein